MVQPGDGGPRNDPLFSSHKHISSYFIVRATAGGMPGSVEEKGKNRKEPEC